MSRPKKKRIVHQPPVHTAFKPVGVRWDALQRLLLTLDEFEAIRLTDYEGLAHSNAADEMEISRSTFTRLIYKARKKMAEFLVEGRQLFIAGGDIHFRGNLIRCKSCGHMFNTGFDQEMVRCPACDSENLLDLAGGFGHGKCCRGHRNDPEK